MAEALAKTFDTAPEVQVTVHFESGYSGGVVVRLAWDDQVDTFSFPWRAVAHLLTSVLTADQRDRINKYLGD